MSFNLLKKGRFPFFKMGYCRLLFAMVMTPRERGANDAQMRQTASGPMPWGGSEGAGS